MLRKERQFQQRWLAEFVPDAVPVCAEESDARSAAAFRRTLELMQRRCPAIAWPALWWAPERLYGTPDLLLLAGRLRRLLDPATAPDALAALDGIPADRYVVVEIKLKSTLETSRIDLNILHVQAGFHAHLLARLQEQPARHAVIFCRNRIDRPLALAVEEMEERLHAVRQQWQHIVGEGQRLQPWNHAAVQFDFRNRDARWTRAKALIAQHRTPGKDPTLVAHITRQHTPVLAAAGFPHLDALLACEPDRLPLDQCPGIGPRDARRIRTVLHANRSGRPIGPARMPPRRRFEFFADYEFFPSLNIDFERQWPTLEGLPMLFMAGCGRLAGGRFDFHCFIARTETPEGEAGLIDEWLAFLDRASNGQYLDPEQTAIYHWSSAEPVHSVKCADRLGLPAGHPLRRLPWADLERTYLNGPCAVPGAFKAGLKTVAGALEKWDPEFGQTWPGQLDAGIDAMMLGWRAYRSPNPAATPEMQLLRTYLEADCRALLQVLRWMRASAEEDPVA